LNVQAQESALHSVLNCYF